METALHQNWPTASQLVKKYYEDKEEGKRKQERKWDMKCDQRTN